MISNSKGQVGKLIAIFPVMFLIFIIMGIFIVLSAGLSIGGKNAPTFSDKIIIQDDLMLKHIDLEIDGKIQTMSVLEAIVKFGDVAYNKDLADADIFKKELDSKLKNFLKNKNDCIWVVPRGAVGAFQSIQLLVRDKLDSGYLVIDRVFKVPVNVKQFSFNVQSGEISKKIIVEYYYGNGECTQ